MQGMKLNYFSPGLDAILKIVSFYMQFIMLRGLFVIFKLRGLLNFFLNCGGLFRDFFNKLQRYIFFSLIPGEEK